MANRGDNLVEVRVLLKDFWDRADLHGRCSGLKKDGNNPYVGSNITLAEGRQLVTLSEDDDGVIVVHQFKRAGHTALGSSICHRLESHGIRFRIRG